MVEQFLAFDCDYTSFVEAASSLADKRQYRLYRFVREAAVFPGVGGLGPSVTRFWRDSARSVRVLGLWIPRTLPAYKLDDIPHWEKVAAERLWWTTCLQEGQEVRDFITPAFETHQFVSIRDPYFASCDPRTSAGAEWILSRCLEQSFPSAEVWCRCEEKGLSDAEAGTQALNRLKQRLIRAVQLANHLPISEFVLRVRVFRCGPVFHDRSLVFKTRAESPWSCGFFVGTGITAFSVDATRSTICGRVTPSDGERIVPNDAIPLLDKRLVLHIDPQPRVVVQD